MNIHILRVQEHFLCFVNSCWRKGLPQHAANSSANHLQSIESHGPEWYSSQTLQHGGFNNHREVCSGVNPLIYHIQNLFIEFDLIILNI